MDRTLLLVKPHAVRRGLTGVFLARFEQMGLRLVAVKSVLGNRTLWEQFYPSSPEWFANAGSKTISNYKQHAKSVSDVLGTDDPTTIGKLIKSWLVEHMASDLVVAVVLEGNEALQKVRTASGKTLPNQASPGTIRFDYSSDSPKLANDEKRPVYNLVHASDPEEHRDGVPAAEFEIKLLFPELTA